MRVFLTSYVRKTFILCLVLRNKMRKKHCCACCMFVFLICLVAPWSVVKMAKESSCWFCTVKYKIIIMKIMLIHSFKGQTCTGCGIVVLWNVSIKGYECIILGC